MAGPADEELVPTASTLSGRVPEMWTLVRPRTGVTAGEAAMAESEGWDGIFVPDSQNLAPDVIVQLTLCSSATSTLKLATGSRIR